MDFKKILFKTTEIDVEKALPDGVIFCSKDGKIQWASDKAAELLETPKMNLLTNNVSDFIENALNIITNAVILGKSIIIKLVDKEVYFEMTASETEEGFVIDFRAAKSDKPITDADCKVINRDKNNFLVKLSNDFKSPLQSIVGFSQAMADGLGGSMSLQQEKYIRIIKKNSYELMYFIEKLIELSKTESELSSPEYRTFDIVNLISSVAKFNEQLCKDKDLRWSINIDENLKKTIVSDENCVKSILQNILEVITKSVEMGEVNVSLLTPDEEFLKSKNLIGEYVQLSVSSSSMLLSESDLESIFDPYMIVDTTNRKNILRSMILASVKNTVASLKGAIWIESQILKSVAFNVLIPVNN